MADHIGQLSQKTRGERSNAEKTIESLSAVIDVLNADKLALVQIATKLLDQSVALNERLLAVAQGLHDAVLEGGNTFGSSATMTWEGFQGVLYNQLYGDILMENTTEVKSALVGLEVLASVQAQYESQSGVILTAAKAVLEKHLALVKKSLLDKPWLKTKEERPAVKPAQATKPTPSVPSVQPVIGTYNGPENG